TSEQNIGMIKVALKVGMTLGETQKGVNTYMFPHRLYEHHYKSTDGHRLKIMKIPEIIPLNTSEIIEEITQVREKNNKNWMGLLKLAFRYAPVEARKIMKNVNECDLKVNQLTTKLTED
ncbi:unnamed protein product, partial [marine sediment metagenome]